MAINLNRDEFDKFYEEVKGKVKGWLSISETFLLAELATRCPHDDCIVEIGSYHGLSTIMLAYGASRFTGSRIGSPIVYAVDPHVEHMVSETKVQYRCSDAAEYYIAMARYPEWSQLVRTVNLPSAAAATAFAGRHVGMMFVDGDHRYEAVRADIDAWFPLLRFGAPIVFHDNNETAVMKAIKETPELCSAGSCNEIEVCCKGGLYKHWQIVPEEWPYKAEDGK